MKAMKEPVLLLWIRPSQRGVVNQLSTTLGQIPARCCILMGNILTITSNGSCTRKLYYYACHENKAAYASLNLYLFTKNNRQLKLIEIINLKK